MSDSVNESDGMCASRNDGCVDAVGNGSKPFLELFVMASGIDHRRIGACLFCQEFWMELYALYEINLVRVEVKTVNVNSEPFKRSFLGALPPILFEAENGSMFTDNREIERRIFHIAKEFKVPLFEKDVTVDKSIESLYRWRNKWLAGWLAAWLFVVACCSTEIGLDFTCYVHHSQCTLTCFVVTCHGTCLLFQNFKLFLRSKTDYERGKEVVSNDIPACAQPAYNKLIEQLTNIDKLLAQRNTRYLVGSSMTMYDCELMPRLHHIRIAGEHLCGVEIPHVLTHLWNYMLTAYRTAAFIESCPADQDICYHYRVLNANISNIPFKLEQLNWPHRLKEYLQTPTKTHTIPDDVLSEIKQLGLDKFND
ncbi:Chloride intracellular channel exc-4 [Trichinella pseudospiralis]|uniref:Chloride intracellular channel exc-4 n=1 Tax=Trichinella pseudospiralis TaxID=6337 RepID=A0A0V1FIF1_TRIPS|nr:Chloride intracellular channel exc-4 [Trichinella pseudospiralis]